jgi:hypothetical protein
MTDRAAAVLAVVIQMGIVRPAVVARVLNLDAPCDWCPVGPPKPGEQCATVPRTSADRVRRVLLGLKRAGKVGRLRMGSRMLGYFIPKEIP